MSRLGRHTFLRGALATAAVPGLARAAREGHAPAGRGKAFAGKTLNVFTFDHPSPRSRR